MKTSEIYDSLNSHPPEGWPAAGVVSPQKLTAENTSLYAKTFKVSLPRDKTLKVSFRLCVSSQKLTTKNTSPTYAPDQVRLAREALDQ